MLHQLWSLVERLTPRLASAGIVFVLAALTNPNTVGYYNWTMLAYTAFQAVTDMPIRHVLVRVVMSPDDAGRTFLRAYRIWAGCLGAMVMSAVLIVLYATSSDDEQAAVLSLFPIVLAPVCTAVGIKYVGVLQAASKWSILARGQLISAALALTVSIPILLLSRSALGASFQVLLTEAIFAAWCLLRSRSFAVDAREIRRGESQVARVYLGMSAYSGLGWLQGQSDRLLVGGIAGSSLLGAYSTASALARSIGDAIASSTANVLRTQVTSLGAEPSAVKDKANALLARSLLLAGGSFVCSVAAIELLARPILGNSWEVALDAAPIIALTAYGSALSWSGSVLQALGGQHWKANCAPLAGLVLAPMIAIAATFSLESAAWLLVAREFVVVFVSFAFLGRAAPWRAFLYMSLATAVSAVLLLVLRAFL